MASCFRDVGASPEDERERDAVAECTVDGRVPRAADAGILSKGNISRLMIPIFNRPVTAVPCQ